jgi:hypothetical protein
MSCPEGAHVTPAVAAQHPSLKRFFDRIHAIRYAVWARGYKLVDSAKVQAKPGKLLDLKPSVPPDVKTAEQSI